MSAEQALKDSEARIVENFNSGNVDPIVGEHTSNVWVLPFDNPITQGEDAVRADFKELIDSGWKNLSMESLDIGVSGDLAYQIGKFAVDMPPENGSSKRVTGKFLDVHQRQPDGSWKIHVTSFSFDQPM